MSRVVIEPGKRSELAMRYTILVMLAPFIFTIPFIKSFGRDLGLPEKHIETDIGIALLGFLLGPVLFLAVAIIDAFLATFFNFVIPIPNAFLILFGIWVIFITWRTFRKIYNRVFNFLLKKYPT